VNKMKVTADTNSDSKEISFSVNKVNIDKESVFPNTILELKSDSNNTLKIEFEKEEYKLLGSRIIDVVSEIAKNDVDMRFYLTMAKKSL